LLVDDEKLERVLIRKGYDWKANGFEIIGEASSGEEALEFFKRKEPDIVITDINMPYMDGLALTEKIREQSSKCRVIIVTGYREFEYARRALQLGVNDFILKPVNINDVATLVEGIKEELSQEEGHSKEYSKLKETAKENQDIVMESFLQRLVENHIDEEEAIHKLQMYSFDSLLEQCICINIKPYLKQTTKELGTLSFSKQIRTLIEKSKYRYVVSFVHYLCNIIIYLKEDDIEQATKIAKQIKDQINQEWNIDVDIGISQINQGFTGISRAYRQAEKAISASIILGRNSCITYDEYAQIKMQNQGNTEIDCNRQISQCL
jgi:two-component system response regulator YesN